MKYLLWIVCGLVSIGLIYSGMQMLASERVEVVELYTMDDAGEEQVTRLWVVDHEGFSYIRAGHEQSGWYLRLKSKPTIKLTRGEKTMTYTTVPNLDAKDAINKLMEEKYTWGETFIGAMFSRENSIPIKLIAQ